MADSQSLKLIQHANKLSEVIVSQVTIRLVEKGHSSITPSLLSFLSRLECGVNQASAIARDIGVSRQMVAKIVKELCHLGYLEQVEGVGKQKDILFTKQGEILISDARQLLKQMDDFLCEHQGKAQFESFLEQLSTLTQYVDENHQQ